MSKMTLIIGAKNYSSWSLRPWLILKHGGIPFKEILIPLSEPGSKEKILKYSPAGKVPALKHGKLTVWESLAIGEYLAEAFPQKDLWPKDLKTRAWARSISHEMHAGFTFLRKNCPMNVRGLFPGQGLNEDVNRDVKRIAEIWKQCRETFRKDGEILFGHFTVADCMYAPVVWRFNSYAIVTAGLARKYFETILALKEMKEWREAALKETFPAIH